MNNDTENLKNKSSKREDYFRCKTCKHLWADGECKIDPVRGNICPNGCIKSFQQPEYELPIQG